MRKSGRYDFLEWYKLDLGIRADLVQLIEGARHGANVELWKLKEKRPLHFLQQKMHLESCLEKLHLIHAGQRDDYYIAADATWLEKLCKGEIEIGEFLGYPKCCVDAFRRGCQRVRSRRLKTGPAVWHCRKMENAHRKGELNQLLFWTRHVPCRLDCKETLSMASETKNFLEKHDSQAAYYLASFNQGRVYEFHYRHPR